MAYQESGLHMQGSDSMEHQQPSASLIDCCVYVCACSAHLVSACSILYALEAVAGAHFCTLMPLQRLRGAEHAARKHCAAHRAAHAALAQDIAVMHCSNCSKGRQYLLSAMSCLAMSES